MPSHAPRRPLARTAATLAALATAAAVHAGDTLTLYVDDDAAPGGDGLSWEAPFRDVQDAIDEARRSAARNSVLERIDILIAQGVYKPDRGTGDRSRSFDLQMDVLIGADVPQGTASLIGGFAGVGAPNPGDRDPARYHTVLSGDLNGDDQPGFINYSDNSSSITGAIAVNSTMIAVFDGLIVRGGGGPRPYAGGGGLGVWGINCVVRNCTIEENYSRYGGAGIYLGNANARIESCIVRDNRADGPGGGIFVDGFLQDTVEVIDTTITGNEAIFGGGLAAHSFITVERCDIINNTAALGGGVHFSLDWFDPQVYVIERSRISENRAWVNGGGIFTRAPLRCHSTLITYNRAGDLGGGLYMLPGTTGIQPSPMPIAPKLTCATIVGNVARRGSGLMLDEVEEGAVVQGSIIWDNSSFESTGQIFIRSAAGATAQFTYNILPGEEGAIDLVESPPPDVTGSIDEDPQFRDPLGLDPDPLNDFALRATSPAIDRGSDPSKLPADLLGNPRAIDVPTVPNLVDPAWPVDMGAIEYIPCPCDSDNDQATTAFDLLLYLDWWFPGSALAERTGDQPPHVDVFDLLAYVDCWFAASAGAPCP